MDELDAQRWAEQHLMYTLEFYEDNPNRGHLFHWDWVQVEWCGEDSPLYDIVPRGEFGEYIEKLMEDAFEWRD